MNRRRLAVGLAGGSRAAAGGLLATGLAVYVGRDGSALAVGMLSTVLWAATMVCSPLWGAVGDLTGRHRRLLVGIAVALSALALAFPLAGGPWGLVGVRAVYALVAVGFAPLLLALVRASAPADRRGRAAGFLASTMAGGDVVAQAAVGLLLVAFRPPGFFAVVAVVSLVGVAGVLLLDPDRPARTAAGPGGAASADTDGSEGGGPGLLAGLRARLVPTPTERATLRATGLDWLFGALVVRHAAVRGIGSLVPLYLLTRLGTGEAVMGLLLTVSPVGQVAFMRLSGDAADLPGRTKQLLLVGFAASALYGPTLAAAQGFAGAVRLAVAAVAFLFIAAGFSALDMGVVSAIGAAVPPERETTYLGFRSTVSGLGGVVGPLLVGALVVRFGYGPAFAVAGALAAVATGVVAVRVAVPGTVAVRTPLTVETSAGYVRPAGQEEDD